MLWQAGKFDAKKSKLLGFLLFVQFYTDDILFHVLIVIYEFNYNLYQTM